MPEDLRMTLPRHIIVVGGGQAGAQAIASLRLGGYEGGLTLVGEENAPPYQRPPLSKTFLKGLIDEDRLYLKPLQYYQDQNVELILDMKASRIDRASRRLHLQSGAALSYDKLILATGSTPRDLPVQGGTLDRVQTLRGIADVERLRACMSPRCRIVIVGAGYIGLEAAAVMRELGAEVTILEMADRVLARVTGEVMSSFFTRLHESHGVDVRTGVRLAALEGETSVTGARLASGEVIACDLVLVGIGITPNEGLAAEAGLACGNGIRVDRDARTLDPDIYAVGDCTKRPLVHYGREARLESVHNAIEQGKLAAAHILGHPRPSEDTPWFWSDQYDVKLQIAGLSTNTNETVVRGDPSGRSFAVFYLQDGHIRAVDAVNAPPEFLASKKLIAANAALARDTLTDTSVSMKEIAAGAMAV